VTPRFLVLAVAAGPVVGAATGTFFFVVYGMVVGFVLGLGLGLCCTLVTSITFAVASRHRRPSAERARRLLMMPSLIVNAVFAVGAGVAFQVGGPEVSLLAMLAAVAAVLLGTPQIALFIHAATPWCLAPLFPELRTERGRGALTAACLAPVAVCLAGTATFFGLAG
jgi:hypothetical protein